MRTRIFNIEHNFLFLLTIFFVCTTSTLAYENDKSIPDDRNHIDRMPESRGSINDFADAIDKGFSNQLEQPFDLPRNLQFLTGRKEAFNANRFDEVNNSSWYTNRNTYKQMSIEEIFAGPNQVSGPDTSSTWTIIRAKADGVTPGFAIEDKNGDKFFIKFDPPGYFELASGAEVVTTKLFFAAGYWTPENYVVFFKPDILRMGEEVKFLDEKGRKRFMNEDDLGDILKRVEILPNGYIRALASRYIPGRPLGPFRYEGTVKDDPNDFIPHEHRRELRGLYVFGSWVNHIDSKAQNSLDSYITDGDKRYVRHYLIDFGTCLGSGGRGPHPNHRGFENEIDPVAMFKKIITFGLVVEDYEKPDTVLFPSIGRFNSDNFEPNNFASIFPNPAYEYMTIRDAYWGAKLVMSFTDDQIDAAVRAGRYSNPEAARYLATQLKERRDIIGRYWFKKIAPLDNFDISNTEDSMFLSFKDMAVESNLESIDNVSYRYYFDKNQSERNILEDKSVLRIPIHNQETIYIEKMVDNRWSDPVGITVGISSDSNKYSILKIDR